MKEEPTGGHYIAVRDGLSAARQDAVRLANQAGAKMVIGHNGQVLQVSPQDAVRPRKDK